MNRRRCNMNRRRWRCMRELVLRRRKVWTECHCRTGMWYYWRWMVNGIGRMLCTHRPWIPMPNFSRHGSRRQVSRVHRRVIPVFRKRCIPVVVISVVAFRTIFCFQCAIEDKSSNSRVLQYGGGNRCQVCVGLRSWSLLNLQIVLRVIHSWKDLSICA